MLLVVSEMTEMEERSLEIINHVEPLVVFTGFNRPSQFWKHLAKHKHYLVTLNTTSENIKSNIHGAAKTVKGILCRGSRLICKTDEFLAEESCVSCSYICPTDRKKHSDICQKLCPYYKPPPPTNAAEDTRQDVQKVQKGFQKVPPKDTA